MIERKYTLTKVRAGDYLLPANDGISLWRIMYAQDDELGVSWQIYIWWDKIRPGVSADPDDWAQWEFWEDGHTTRAEAIQRALALKGRS